MLSTMFINSSFLKITLYLLLCSFNPFIVNGRNSSLTAYYLRIYNQINAYRAEHTVAALHWNLSLTETAETFAKHITHLTTLPNHTFHFDIWTGYNFFISPGSTHPPSIEVVGTWYDECLLYNWKSPGYSHETANFTQLIWKSSTSIGIGLYTDGNNTALVAKFYPLGNIRGKFKQNVVAKYEMI